MEHSGQDNTSDKDKDMKRRKAFEAFDPAIETEDDDEEEEKQPDKKSLLDLIRTDADDKTEKKSDEKSKQRTEEDKETKADKPEAEITLEKATETITKYVQERIPELEEERANTEPGTSEQTAIDENIALIEAIQEHAKEVPAEEAIEAAFEERVAALEEKTETLEGEISTLEEEVVTAEAEPDAVPEYDPITRTTTPTPPTPPLPSVGSSGGGGYPPSGGTPRFSVPPSMPPFGGPNTPNTLSPPPAAEKSAPEEVYVRRGSRAGDLLVGGLLGYAIGRRGGRLRTEARLGKEIKSLHANIAEKETIIRQLAIEKAEVAPTAKMEQQVEKAQEALESMSQTQTLPALETQPETPVVTTNRESVAAQKVETGQATESPKSKLTPEIAKSVTMLSMPELLTVADKIEFNGVSVKEMYENQRLDAVNLRRVVDEYLRGGNYERTLADQLQAEEGRRERAIEGQPRQTTGVAVAAGGGIALSSDMPPAWDRGQALSSVSDTASSASSSGFKPVPIMREQRTPPVWMIASIGLGLIIAALVIILK